MAARPGGEDRNVDLPDIRVDIDRSDGFPGCNRSRVRRRLRFVARDQAATFMVDEVHVDDLGFRANVLRQFLQSQAITTEYPQLRILRQLLGNRADSLKRATRYLVKVSLHEKPAQRGTGCNDQA